MDINFIFKIAAIGVIVAFLGLIFKSSNREDLATITTIAGIVVVLFMVFQQISKLFDTVKSIFRL